MATDRPIELEVEIQVQDTTEEDLDRMTRNLLSELRETDIESVNLVSTGPGPEGSKGDPVTIGTLAVIALPVVLQGVIDVIKAWVERGKGRTVKFKSKGIEFEGSPEELEKVLNRLARGKSKK